MWVYPRYDAEWARKHKSDLISYRVCSMYLNQGKCDNIMPGCSFNHELPERIDVHSAEWQQATTQAAGYRARMQALRQGQHEAQLALPSTTMPPLKATSAAAVVSKVQITEEPDDIDEEMRAKLDAQLTLAEWSALTAQ